MATETATIYVEIKSVVKKEDEQVYTLNLVDYKEVDIDGQMVKQRVKTLEPLSFDIPFSQYDAGITTMGNITSVADETAKMYQSLLADYNTVSIYNSSAVWELAP